MESYLLKLWVRIKTEDPQVSGKNTLLVNRNRSFWRGGESCSSHRRKSALGESGSCGFHVHVPPFVKKNKQKKKNLQMLSKEVSEEGLWFFCCLPHPLVAQKVRVYFKTEAINTEGRLLNSTFGRTDCKVQSIESLQHMDLGLSYKIYRKDANI